MSIWLLECLILLYAYKIEANKKIKKITLQKQKQRGPYHKPPSKPVHQPRDWRDISALQQKTYHLFEQSLEDVAVQQFGWTGHARTTSSR